MIRKIISSGQTGVELAALDVAVKLGITHGGRSPRGMHNEDGPIEKRYGLEQVAALGFEVAQEKNVDDSDGTLLITRGEKTPQVQHAVKTALRMQRQFLHVDLSQHTSFEAASLIDSWMTMNNVQIVFVTGTPASRDPKIYGQVKKILETAFYLEMVKTGMHPNFQAQADTWSSNESAIHKDFPKTVDEAVQQLKAILPLKDRTMMANMQSDELDHLETGLGEYIKQHFGLYTGNQELMQSCAQYGNLQKLIPDEACAVILRALWQDLKSTHKLRIIK